MIQEDLPKIVKLAKSIEHDASVCVKCGLCLEHCPTYLRTHDENESPRGRIALLDAVAKESVQPNPALKKHIDQCLTCRACETVCPAFVPYGNIIDAGRTFLHEKKLDQRLPLSMRFMQWLIQKPKRMKRFHKLLWLAQITGLRAVSQLLHIPNLFGIKHLDRLLGKTPKPQTLEASYSRTSQHHKGRVGLFVGCMHRWLDPKPLFDAIHLLTHLGFDVEIPKSQQCCGALFRHEGVLDQAITLSQNNLNSFEKNNLDFITYLPSGCGSELKHYGKLLAKSKVGPAAKIFSEKVYDILTIIQKTNCLEKIQPRGFAKPKTAFIHTPCTLKHHLRQKDPAIALLAKIPNLNVVPFHTQTCCGAAGNHMIKHPDTALEYLSPYFYEFNDIQPDYIVSSNIGCALHFKQGLQHFGKKAIIIHPVSLLAASITGEKNV